MTFHVGVQLHPQATSYVELRDAWRRAESIGVDSIWTWDHFFPLACISASVPLKLTAQHADAWNSFGPPETFAHKNAVLDNWCAEIGRDPAEIGRDPAEIERTVAIGPDDVDQLDAFLEAGATHIIVMTGHPFDLAAVEVLIARRDA